MRAQHIITILLTSSFVSCSPDSDTVQDPIVVIHSEADSGSPSEPSDMRTSPSDFSTENQADIPESQAPDLGQPTPPEDLWTLPTISEWPSAEDLDPSPDIVEVNIRAANTDIEIAPGRTLTMMTYNGLFPGPLLQAKVGDRVIVHFENALDEPTTIHWHGLRIPDDMDGSPRIQNPVQPGDTFTYDFIVPDAGTFWYHPHVRTNEQLERGLYGPLIVHDEADPEVGTERIIIVDDALLDGDDFAPFLANHMEFVHGRTGNTLLINGAISLPISINTPHHTERWRIINTSNARTFSLSLEGAPKMQIVATDGGRVETPYETDRLEVAVGQRYDILIKHERDRTLTLNAHILTLDANNNVIESAFPLYEAIPTITEAPAPTQDWSLPSRIQFALPKQAEIVFDGYTDASGQIVWTLNGQANASEPLFSFSRGDTVTLTLVNKQNPEHPFHLHGQFFEILDNGYGEAIPGLKDTVLVPGRRTVQIRAYMSNPGMWMAHCHILEHAELGMMSEIQVLPEE